MKVSIESILGRGGLEGGFPFKECDRQSNCKSSFARGAVTFGPTNFCHFHFPGLAFELVGPTLLNGRLRFKLIIVFQL